MVRHSEQQSYHFTQELSINENTNTTRPLTYTTNLQHFYIENTTMSHLIQLKNYRIAIIS